MESGEAETAQRILNEAQARLWRAFVGALGEDGADDAVAEALAWGWEHRNRLVEMTNPVGYLYRVGQTRAQRSVGRRRPPVGLLPEPHHLGVPDIEPGLLPALLALPDKQRQSVWLVHACGWTHAETADALDIGRTTVATHISRAMTKLRASLEVTTSG